MFSSRSTTRVLLFTVIAVCTCNGRSISRRDKDDDAILSHKLRELLGKLHKVADQQKTIHQKKSFVPCPNKGIIYLNGRIYTVNKNVRSWQDNPKEALIIEDGSITFIGTTSEAESKYMRNEECMDKYTIFDLDGRAVFPGFHDVHIHPLEAGTKAGGGCELPSQTAPNSSEMTSALNECLKFVDGNGTNWVLGGGHSITNILKHIEGGGKSPRLILDDIIPNKPAIMLEETSHSCWVNSKALEIADIKKSTPETAGGIIMRGNDNEPNGILFENAVISIMDKALKPNPQLNKITYNGLLDSLQLLREHGITSICDARVYWKREHDKLWEKACKEGKLTVRTVLGLWAYPAENDMQQIQKLKEMYSESSPDCDNFLRKTQIKVYSDGLLESTTAAMLKKYNVDLHLPNNTENKGMNYFTQERLTKYITELQELDIDGETGFDFHVHTIGDRGVRETLDAIENSQYYETRESRHRLTHVEVVNPDDRRRFSDLGVTADFQVVGDFALPEVSEEHVSKLIGLRRAKDFIPVHDIKKWGAKTTFSSDWDVSDINPFKGIQHALQRGNQSVTLSEAIEMYTINSAYVMRQEKKVGSLEVEKEGDLIVVDQDIFRIDHWEIEKTKVLQTVVGGEIIYDLDFMVRDVTAEYLQEPYFDEY